MTILETRVLRAYLIDASKTFKGFDGIEPNSFFTLSDRVCRGHDLKLYKNQATVDIRKSSATSQNNKKMSFSQAKETFGRSFVCSRIDYANSLLYDVSGTLLKKLQRIQNMAARLITGRRKFDQITPVLGELHWLPIKERIEYKLSSLISKCMHDQAPKYLKDFCIPESTVSGCQRLRLAAV